MKIAWIILTWNSAGYIQSCIDSILCLKKIENQIIVIDNGSADNTVQILEKYKEKIKLIREQRFPEMRESGMWIKMRIIYVSWIPIQK